MIPAITKPTTPAESKPIFGALPDQIARHWLDPTRGKTESGTSIDEDLRNWTRTNVPTVTKNMDGSYTLYESNDGGSTMHHLAAPGSSEWTAGKTARFSFKAKPEPNGRNYVVAYHPINNVGVFFDVVNGLVTDSAGAGYPDEYTIEGPDSDGRYTCEVAHQFTTNNWRIYTNDDGSGASYQGDGRAALNVTEVKLTQEQIEEKITAWTPTNATVSGTAPGPYEVKAAVSGGKVNRRVFSDVIRDEDYHGVNLGFYLEAGVKDWIYVNNAFTGLEIWFNIATGVVGTNNGGTVESIRANGSGYDIVCSSPDGWSQSWDDISIYAADADADTQATANVGETLFKIKVNRADQRRAFVWSDQIGSLDISQSTAASQPAIVVENGKVHVSSDGVDDEMAKASSTSLLRYLHDGTGCTLAFAFRVDDLNNGFMASNALTASHTGFRVRILSSVVRVEIANSTGTFAYSASSGAISADKWYVVVYRMSATNHLRCELHDVAAGTFSTFQDATIPASLDAGDATQDFTVFNAAGGVGYKNCDIKDIVIVDEELLDTGVSNLVTWLKGRAQ